jgi:hypothetical protein
LAQLLRDGLLVEIGTSPPTVIVFKKVGQLLWCFGHDLKELFGTPSLSKVILNPTFPAT